MKRMITVLGVSGLLTGLLGGCAATDQRSVEVVQRPLASAPTQSGTVHAGRLDHGPAALANPGPSWTVLTVEQQRKQTRVFDPRTGLMITRSQATQSVREDPWLAAPITLPDTRGTSGDLRHPDRGWGWDDHAGDGGSGD